MEEVKKDKNAVAEKTTPVSLPVLWKNLKTEFQKITWLDQKTFIRQTIVVVCAAVGIGVLIALLDLVINFIMGLIL